MKYLILIASIIILGCGQVTQKDNNATIDMWNISDSVWVVITTDDGITVYNR